MRRHRRARLGAHDADTHDHGERRTVARLSPATDPTNSRSASALRSRGLLRRQALRRRLAFFWLERQGKSCAGLSITVAARPGPNRRTVSRWRLVDWNPKSLSTSPQNNSTKISDHAPIGVRHQSSVGPYRCPWRCSGPVNTDNMSDHIDVQHHGYIH